MAEILLKIYGYINTMKVYLAVGNTDAVWSTLNELNDYIMSIEVPPMLTDKTEGE